MLWFILFTLYPLINIVSCATYCFKPNDTTTVFTNATFIEAHIASNLSNCSSYCDISPNCSSFQYISYSNTINCLLYTDNGDLVTLLQNGVIYYKKYAYYSQSCSKYPCAPGFECLNFICNCPSNSYYDNGICKKSCIFGWTLIDNSCYRISTAANPNGATVPNLTIISSLCGHSKAKLAKITSSNIFAFVVAHDVDVYVDAFVVTSAPLKAISQDGSWVVQGPWSSSQSSGSPCIVIKRIDGLYHTDYCTHNHQFVCQYYL